MKQNLGSVDRILRAIIAAALFAISLTGVITGVVSTIAIILAVVMLLTAATGFCPLYMLFKLSTKRA